MNALIQNIERRIASWSQIPESHGEPIQVLRYKPGEEYRSHYDYFFHNAGKLNNRVATVLMYLSDVEVRSHFNIVVTSISFTFTDSITRNRRCALVNSLDREEARQCFQTLTCPEAETSPPIQFVGTTGRQ